MKQSRFIICLTLAILFVFGSSGSIIAADFPSKPIKVYVGFSPGGGTDLIARTVASVAPEYLGQSMIIINKTGAAGTIAAKEVANAKPDGYTLGIATVEVVMMHWVGLTELTYKDYTPIGLYNADPAGVQVAADSPWNSVADLVAAAKANPGKFKGSGTSQGGIWHLALAGWLQAASSSPGKASRRVSSTCTR